MAPRDPKRKKCSHVPDTDMLAAVDDTTATGVWIGDHFPLIPPKVVIEKLRKLQGRGLLTIYHEGKTARYILTQAGKEALRA